MAETFIEYSRRKDDHERRRKAAFDANFDGSGGSLTAAEPSLRSDLAALIGSGLAGIGFPGGERGGYQYAKNSVMPVAEMTGVGALTAAGDAVQADSDTDLQAAALDFLPGPNLADDAARAVSEIVPRSNFALPAPAVHTRGTEPMVEKIYRHAEEQRTPKYPMAKEPVFAPADPELTKEIVPQVSIRDKLPPTPEPGNMPLKGRAQPIWESRHALAQQLADDLLGMKEKPLPFYSTGTVLAGLADKGGLNPDEAHTLMRDWAGQGAATSPRTKTPPNLRNASYLQFRRAQGDPLTTEKRGAEGNRPGFPMMDMHTDLADQFATDSNNFWTNPKPSTFRENWTGNMADVTADTHNIRKILDAYDRLFPGTLQRQWFDSQGAFDAYVANKGFPQGGQLPDNMKINDSLGGQKIGGKDAQTEYSVMAEPTYLAAEKLGISPAEAQERLWFQGGPRTGLKSPPMTIPDLLNAQFEATAKVLGISPDEVMRLWARRQIPLAANEPQNVPGESAVG